MYSRHAMPDRAGVRVPPWRGNQRLPVAQLRRTDLTPSPVRRSRFEAIPGAARPRSTPRHRGATRTSPRATGPEAVVDGEQVGDENLGADEHKDGRQRILEVVKPIHHRRQREI